MQLDNRHKKSNCNYKTRFCKQLFSIWNVSHFLVTGTILRTHLDFSPRMGSVHPFSGFRGPSATDPAFPRSRFNVLDLGVDLQRARKFSYRIFTSSYDNPDFLHSISLTVSCKL